MTLLLRDFGIFNESYIKMGISFPITQIMVFLCCINTKPISLLGIKEIDIYPMFHIDMSISFLIKEHEIYKFMPAKWNRIELKYLTF